MKAFVTWIYTGNIRTCSPCMRDLHCERDPSFNEMAERLCVLGDQLLAPAFTNDSMEFLRRRYELVKLSPSSAAYVYSTTLPESGLRLFVKDLIHNEGPLQHEGSNIPDDLDAWTDLLSKGGDLTRDCVDALFQGHESEYPVAHYLFHKYLEPIPDKSVSDWIKAKQDQ